MGELARIKIEGETVKQAVLGETTSDHFGGGNFAKLGKIAINGSISGMYAVVQNQPEKTLILVAVPSPRFEERGFSNFRAVVKGLKAKAAAPAKPAPTPTVDAWPIPKLPSVVGVTTVTASSTFADAKQRDRHAAWRVLEFPSSGGHPQTAWCEGKPDLGLGESITVQLAAPTQLDAILIAPGFWKSAALFKANNLVTSIEVAVDGKITRASAGARGKWITVPTKDPVTSFTIKVTGATAGKMNDSCISGVKLMRGKTSLVAVRGAAAAGAGSLPRAIKTIQDTLASDSRAGLDKLVAFPLELDDAANFSMGGKAVTYTSWKTMEVACKQPRDDDTVVCPNPVSFREGAEGELRMYGDGSVTLVWPSSREVVPVWHLVWKSGAWRLKGVDYEGIGR